MKTTHKKILAGMILSLSSAVAVAAATDTKTIDIEVSKDNFVLLIGSAVDGNIKHLDIDSVKAGTPTNLGTLGLKSNLNAGAGNVDCVISFSTLNNYDMKHESSGTSLRKYNLTYQNKVITDNADAAKDVTVNCKQAPTSLKFTPVGNILADADIESGIYKDTVTVTVTAP